MPGKDFLIAEGKLRISIGIGFLDLQRCLDGQIKIKLYHAIGKEVIIGNATIFIRPLAKHKVGRAVRMNDAAAIPETSSFDVDFHGLQVKAFIACCIKVLLHSEWTVLEKLHAVHIPMAIGSSSKNTPLIVEKLGIGKFFDVIVDGNQISHSKPDPEVFLLAAEKLHQKPSDCLVVEDAEAGVKAALNGGFLVAGIGPAKDCPNINYPLLSLSELLAIEGHPA